ncbi:MAG: hypothetical protein HeimC3_10550 [Candidatus Heimdallarchaeota archaeon LC_3]|nr:MAG: hypothetical protein HeimC3_10550 [Candidatus Heimdallarchaeota archaeon LC_3]
MRYFSIVPVPEFIDEPNKVKIDGEIFDEIECTKKWIKIKFDDEYASEKGYDKEYIIVEFNVLPGVHSWIEENTPLELLWTASADFLESLGKNHNVYLYHSKPNGLESLLTMEDASKLLLPFQVRGANKALFPNIFSMVHIENSFLSPLEMISEQPEDYIRNAMFTFHKNVVPTGEIKRFYELMDVVIPEVEKIEERFRILTRIISPLVHFIVLKKDLSKSLEIKRGKNNNYNLDYKNASKISLKEVSERITRNIAD